MEFHAKEQLPGLLDWMRQQMKARGGKTAVIGISGGKDSSVVAALAVAAYGKENVVGVLMPDGIQPDIDYSNGLVEFLGIRHYVFNIQGGTGGILDEMARLGLKPSRQTTVNLPSRMRMVTLYAIAQSEDCGIVLNTSNLSEDWVGYCTVYGDATGAFSPLGMYTTEEVIALGAELGLPDNALEDTPLCPFCNDTGYRGGEMCRCLKTYYVEEQRKELSKLLDLGSQSFDTFDTDWYSDQRAPGKTKSAREHMEWVYDTCVEYAHNFGKKPANLLLFGRPGLGKTHLSAAIAREVSGKGFSVVYDTAGHVFERFEAQKFGRDEADRDVERVMGCDLLILDDLGTEMLTAFVQSALYQIINGRLLEKKSTIISTNLMPEALGQRYSEQIASRVEGEYQLLPFVGEDIRTLKKKRGL